MVILATVSINAAYNSGIIDYTVNGTQEYVEKAKEEERRIANTVEMMENALIRQGGSQGGE